MTKDLIITDLNNTRVSSSYFFLFFEHIPIFSHFKTKTSYFPYFLAGEARIWNKIENGIVVVLCFRVTFIIRKYYVDRLWCSTISKNNRYICIFPWPLLPIRVLLTTLNCIVTFCIIFQCTCTYLCYSSHDCWIILCITEISSYSCTNKCWVTMKSVSECPHCDTGKDTSWIEDNCWPVRSVKDAVNF